MSTEFAPVRDGADIYGQLPPPGLPADHDKITVQEWNRRFPPGWGVPAPAPHLVLDRAPTLEELHLKRREIARLNQLPRDGFLVCDITTPDAVMDADLLLWEQRRKGRSMHPRIDYQPRNGHEIGRIYGWILEAALG